MNILWVSDFSLKHNIGGAQRSDALLINYGRELKHNITEINYDSTYNYNKNADSYDWVISSNLEAIYRNRPEIFNYIISSPNHARIEHDMNRYLPNVERKELFQSCKKTFFLTQYHYELFKQTYGDFFKNVEIVNDPIDSYFFFNQGKKREDKILYAGFMHDLKGTKNFFDYALDNPLKSFVVAGWGDKVYQHLAFSVPNVTYLGIKSYEEMPDIYNTYETMFYSPVIPEPFCRSVGEALMCGMKFIVNDKIGCLHEMKRLGSFEAFAKNCTEAPKTFWEKLA